MPESPDKQRRAAAATNEVDDLMRSDPVAAAHAAHRALKKHPKFAPLWHVYGLSLNRSGRVAEAARSLRRAAQIAPEDGRILSDLCNVLRGNGSLDEAINVGRRAIIAAPDMPAAFNNLGAALRQAGLLDEAEEALRKALALAPDSADIHNNLGNVFKARMEYGAATAAYREAIRQRPDYAQAKANLGATLVEIGDWGAAREICDAAIADSPNLPEAHRNLGAALYWQGCYQEAITSLRHADSLAPGDPMGRKLLALALIESDQILEATETLVSGLENDRPPPGTNTNRADLLVVTSTKLRHDLEQYKMLANDGVGDPDLATAVDDIEATLADAALSGDAPIDLRRTGKGRASQYVNRFIHLERQEALAEGTLNDSLDLSSVEREFAASEGGFVVVDNLLSTTALRRLRRFCERSTIWFQSNFAGELGTSMVNGFATPLLFQLARDLQRGFPSIFGPHRFQACWSYRYYADQSGLDLHTDAATVSMNIWLTPDEANLDPNRGGLVFWNRRGPKDFFTKPMAEKAAILEAIASEDGAQPVSVPYRCNRALLFGAGIVHKTDDFRFKDGYDDRRMNMTFLFGPPA